jgi:hypothetical protein
MALAAVLFPATSFGARPLDTALVASAAFYGGQADIAFEHARSAGTSAIRLQLSWRDIAPEGAVRPPGFDATNPFDGAYRWGEFDQLVRRSVAYGLEPVVGISETPSWAERGGGGRPGTNRPDPAELGSFAEAAARRYSGQFSGLPRVSTWEVWNEANASFFLYPQEENGQPFAPAHYRSMVNAVADGVRQVHPDNRVAAGGLFPFVIARPGVQAIGPLRFMRELFCLSKRLRPISGCGDPVRFDLWTHHPYTSGSPTHKASNPDNVSIRELPSMAKVLRAAVRFNRVIHSKPVRFWVTEFSWDTNPPDPKGVPLKLHARWVSEALYRMWRSGVSLVTWFQLRDGVADGRPHGSVFESGLYSRCNDGLACDSPKPSFQAFRFPFVAFRSGRKVRIWGRMPAGVGGKVVVEQEAGRSWRALATLRANRVGIFTRRLRTRRHGALRARRTGGDVSIPFSLVRPPDRAVNPFG